MAATATTTGISLSGSVKIVTEFFEYSSAPSPARDQRTLLPRASPPPPPAAATLAAVNNILYQREIYPPESFKRVAKYGLAMFVSNDDGLQGYLSNVMMQMHEWLTTGNVQKLVLVVTGQESGETLERWEFDLHVDKSVGADAKIDKSDKEIQSEIAAIQRQIIASVTFLPLNDEPCAFDLLVYTDDDIIVPKAWEESDPKHIQNGDKVKLRSFTTTVHTVESAVSYKADRD